MQVNAYLSFRGDCEEAFALYAECLGGKVGEIFRYGGTPLASQVPDDWTDKVMHGSLTIGGQVFMGGDVSAGYEPPRSFSMSIHLDDAAQAERVYQRLAQGGTIVTPLEKTFWAARFGMLVDRFGVPWLINCAEPASAGGKQGDNE
jgi:PhnB protein